MFHRLTINKLGLLIAVFVLSAVGNSLSVVRAAEIHDPARAQQQCPKVSVNSPASVKAGDPLMFTVNAIGGDKNVTPTYNWSVSAGAIESGQGTGAITVDTTGIGGQSVTATVDLGGYERTCSAYSSSTTSVELKAEAKKVTEYGAVALINEHVVLDTFAIELQNDPTSQGYIIAYGEAGTTAAKVDVAAKRAHDYLVKTGKMDDARFVVVNGGNRKTAVTELWLVPMGATPPKPTPDAAPAKTTPLKPKTPPATK